MPLATEVARIHSARLNRRNKSIPAADSKIPRFINTRISISRSRQEILKKLRAKKCRSE